MQSRRGEAGTSPGNLSAVQDVVEVARRWSGPGRERARSVLHRRQRGPPSSVDYSFTCSTCRQHSGFGSRHYSPGVTTLLQILFSWGGPRACGNGLLGNKTHRFTKLHDMLVQRGHGTVERADRLQLDRHPIKNGHRAFNSYSRSSSNSTKRDTRSVGSGRILGRAARYY
jgi:hypothetical protein